ncbi:IS30 family transposase [Pseudoalteromonas sp. SCSIO 43210]
MTDLSKRGLSDIEKLKAWFLWREGKTLSEIGLRLDRHAGSIFGVLKLKGGISPVQRKRRLSFLSLEERENISRGLASGLSIRVIARNVEKAASTVSREIKRNGGIAKYRAVTADKNALERALRPKQCKLQKGNPLSDLVESKLLDDWSPEQISGWLKIKHPASSEMHISHETIYKTLFIPSRYIFEKAVLSHLRSKRKLRHGKRSTNKGIYKGIIDAKTIHERPHEIETRATLGHWEGDLISGSSNSHIATLVDRKTRYTALVQVDGKDTNNVVNALILKFNGLPKALKNTLTWDRGMELADHKRFTKNTNTDVYFCDPSSPWQRGTNENTNRLLRQYFPKKTSLHGFDQRYLDKIANKLNNRPRRILNYLTPNDMIKNHVALTT